MSYELNALFSFSVGLGAIIGWVRIKKIDPVFFPFLIWLAVSFLNELCSYYITKSGYSNIINYNIFLLFEVLVINWQFWKWKLYEKQKKLYLGVQSVIAAGWIVEVIIKGGLHQFNSYFIIISSALIVVLSINMLNKIMFKEPSFLLTNSIFLVCIGLVIYFTYSILVETFWQYGLYRSRDFRVSVYEILTYINLITNLIFGIAAIWIPMKPRYILRS